MTPKQWLNLILSGAAVAALPILPSFSRAQGAAESSESATDIARRESEQQRQILLGDNRVDQRVRDEAARRLLQTGSMDALREALRDPREMPQIAAARALSETESPPVSLLDDLIRLLPARQGTRDLVEATAQALANYKDRPEAAARLREFTQQGLVSDRLRALAIRALGTLNDKETAATLMNLLQGDDTQLISDSAAEALAEMTGRVDFGNDVSQWRAWWQQQARKSDAVFRDERIRERFGELRLIGQQIREATSAIERAALDAIRLMPAAERDNYNLARLRDPSPLSRTAGTSVIIKRLADGDKVGPTVLEQLRSMIGDSNSEVRKRVALAIRNINDPASVRPILAQLQRERDAQVKAALIEALAPTKDLSTVPEMIKLLENPATPFRVAEAAASTLSAAGTEIVKNPEFTRQVSNALARTLERTATARAPRLRERLVEAMIPLRDPGLIRLLQSIPGDPERNTPSTRNYAIKALSEMQSTPQQSLIAEVISDALARDRDAGVRLEAVKALGVVGGPAQAGQLASTLRNEPDVDIKEAARRSLTALFQNFEWTPLRDFADREFRDDPPTHLIATLAVIAKLQPLAATESANLAIQHELAGTLYLNSAITQPDAAIPHFLAALTYWDGQPGGKTEALQMLTMRSYLLGKKYKEAALFAVDRITRNAPNQEPMAREILREVARLRDANEYNRALELLTATRPVPIQGRYREDLDTLTREINSKITPSLFDLFPRPRRDLYA